MNRRALFAFAIVATLAGAGCLSALKGLRVAVTNDTDAPVEGVLTLRRPDGDEVASREFSAAPGESLLLKGLTRDAGLFTLNVTLSDGRSAELDVRGGGTLQDPTVFITREAIILEQREPEEAPGFK